MENLDDYSPENLQKLSYRFLQQTAKALSLPSNVKKVYLIQLIHAKKFCSGEQVERLVKQVRLERQQQALVRKRAKNRKQHVLQSTAISSTSNSKSPPIISTPKRVTQITIRYSPDQYLLPKRCTNRQIIRTVGQTTVSASDRVLRSSRMIKNPSFVLNNRVTTVRMEDKYQQVNMTSLLKKRGVEWRGGNELVPITQEAWQGTEIVPMGSQNNGNMSPQPMRRQRRLSGIYPLNEKAQTANRALVSVRRADGTLSRLNAYYMIHKPLSQNNCIQDKQGRDSSQSLLSVDSTESSTTLSAISISDNFSSTIASTISSETSLSYENSAEEINLSNISAYKENEGEYTVYYHKKIRAEQVRSLRKETARSVSEECRLPKINDVFSQFSDVFAREGTQPVYVQVENTAETPPNCSVMYPELRTYQSTMLESLYNLKQMFVMNQPLSQVPTTSNTRCVYSTPVICTAKAQPTAAVCNLYNIALSQDEPQYCVEPRDQHFGSHYQDHRYQGSPGVGRAGSSTATSPHSQELGANVTVPEMVEDALELISQDGDYMERMGMDIRVQCVLCTWAGPKIILEYHVRNKHGSEISQYEGGEWCSTLSLGHLASSHSWSSLVVERNSKLYVVSARYDDPDWFCATLSAISSEDDIPETGSITTYNKVTGEPYSWEGLVQQLPLTSPSDTDCLKLELSRMNLLPNSANLKLLNRELVVRSPTKVVVGQPELDNIHITLIVKIYD